MKIYITTLGRVRAQKTLMNLPETLRREVVLVVQEHEYVAHRDKWIGQVAEVRALSPDIRTLGPTRRAVHGWREDSKIVLLDDDLDFYVRAAPRDWHLLTPSASQVLDMFGEINSSLDRYAHVGVGGREGHNRVEEDTAECTRYMRVLGYRTDVAPEVEHGRVDGMSDFDVNMQLLRLGYPSLVLYFWGQGQSGTQTPGGCAINRTHDTHNSEIAKMLAWHGEHVRARQKVNKTGGEFGTRQELTLYWKRAFEEGVRKHGRRVLP